METFARMVFMYEILKNEIMQLLNAENALLDLVLTSQAALHNCVKDKNWTDLEKIIWKLNIQTSDFQKLESQREEICEGINISQVADFAPVLKSVRGKLLKSKAENSALSDYIKATQKFLNGIFDEAIPARKNITYGRGGLVRKAQMKSLVLNQLY